MLAARVEQKNGTYVHNIQTGIQLRRTPPASPCSVSFRIAVHTRLGYERKDPPSCCAGVVATACTQGKRAQHGRPQGVVRDDQPDAREGQAGRRGESERSIIPMKPGMRLMLFFDGRYPRYAFPVLAEYIRPNE